MSDNGLDHSAPLISVVIPAYNARTTLERALRSVVAQSYRPLEVIVVDDASVDGTADFARNFSGLPIHVERLDQQVGAAAARNRGIEVSQGEFIAFLDADDEWVPEKTTLQLAVMMSDPSLSFATCEADLVAPRGEFMYVINRNRARPRGQDAWKTLLKHPCVGTPCVMARRTVLQNVGGFNPALMIGEDQDLWIRLALSGPVHHIDQSLVRVHDRPNSLSKAQRGQPGTSTLPMILGHMEAQKHRLSAAEIDGILGLRYTEAGRTHYETGNISEGVRFLFSAISRGYRPLENLSYIVSASPPMRVAKRITGYHRAIPSGVKFAERKADTKPLLTVVIDTEEEFDWSNPFNSRNRGVTAINHLPMAQAVHEKHGIVPTYVVDYPVADDANSVAVLQRIAAGGRAVIGAHLQPWVNPPFEEAEELINTYPGNLPFSLEYRKLAQLTERIEAQFGVRPTIYKAGRYGLGPATAKILKSLGYEIDASVLPFTNLRYRGGPDFGVFPNVPFWFGEGLELFEVPLTRGFTGLFRGLGAALFPFLDHPLADRLQLVGAFAKFGLLDRVTLTPEGVSLEEHKRLTRVLLKQGCKIFSYTYHSSSLLPGATQYVRSYADRDAFLEKMDRYFEFFMTEVGGCSATLGEIRDLHSPGAVSQAEVTYPTDADRRVTLLPP